MKNKYVHNSFMKIIHSISAFREFRNALSSDTSVGFVPTMGALHAGHASLIAQSAQQNAHTVVSIFVNPTQFGPKEDFGKYPRTLEADVALAAEAGATVVFAPAAAEIYPEKQAEILFSLFSMDKKLCGKSRPGHFNGVVQVVSLLFHIVAPHRAYFGKKDFQQFSILRRLIKEQHFPIEIIGCETVREASGLAMSSRNRYLSAEETTQATALSRILLYLQSHLHTFESKAAVYEYVNQEIARHSALRLDYFDVLNSMDLSEIDDFSETNYPHGFIAAFCGSTRLIDNMEFFR